jgi:hypothetical protein
MTETTELTLRYTLSDTCSCEDYDEETQTSSPSENCYGCWQDDLDNIKYDLLEKWMTANGYEIQTPILINAKNINWDRRSGYKLSNPENLISDLSLDNDFTLYFYSNDDYSVLEVARSSHDEYRATFTFEVAEIGDEDDE